MNCWRRRSAWLQLFDSEYHPSHRADIKSLVEGKTSSKRWLEIRLKKPDGSHDLVRRTGYAVRDAQRRLIAIEGILTDITERKLRRARKLQRWLAPTP